MKRLLFIGCLLLVASGVCVAQSPSAFTLTIIPTKYSRGSRQAVISLNDHFHVLLTNNSADTLAIYEEWNSWGYFNLWFEITYPDGRQVKSYKALRSWNRNFPSTTTIPPHGYYVFDVDFNTTPTEGDVWDNSIRNETGFARNGSLCRLRAVYSSSNKYDPPPFFPIRPAWTGTVSSEDRAYIVYP